jgi:hypothetical protein
MQAQDVQPTSQQRGLVDAGPVPGLEVVPMPASGPLVPPGGSRLAAWCLKVLGWRNDFPGLPDPRGLLVVYPHTSNWDFPLGLLYKWSHGLPFRFWIKDSATRLPVIGRWIRWVGGVAINRKAAHGVVEQTMQQMREADFFWLAVAPEGTRSYTNGWRTGFYHLWRAADCPLGLAYFDYGHKQIGVQHYVRCSGDMEADFAALARYYERRTGYHPEKAAPVRPYERGRSRDADAGQDARQ